MTEKILANATRDALLKQIRERDGGTLRREAEVVGVVDREARTVEVAFSSEVVVRRWFGDEVLSHDPAHVRMGRLDDGAAMLWGHNWNDQRGVVESARIDADGKGRALLRFSRNPDGEELMNDVDDRIVRHISVGYFVHDFVVREVDGRDRYVLTDWEPYEISFVSVPADMSVGVGRSAEIPQEEERTTDNETRTHAETSIPERTIAPTMKIKNLRNAAGDLVRAEVDDDGKIVRELETLEAAGEGVTTATSRGAAAERERGAAILTLATRFGKSVDKADELARTAIAEGHSVEKFQAALLEGADKRMSTPLSEQSRHADVGLSDKEIGAFSMLKVCRALADPNDSAARKAASFEFSVSEAAAERSGKTGERFVIPTDVLRHAVGHGSRAMNTNTGGGAAGNTGGFAVETTLQTASFIDILRNRATAMKMGRVLGGLVGNIDIPKQAAAATGYWLGEDDDATETGIELGQISMTPKTVAAYSEVTRKLLMQSSMDIEAMLRSDLALALALTIDRAAYYGSGTEHQPKGIANHTGINAVALTAGAATFPKMVEMETAIALDNADVVGMKYVTNASNRGYWKTTEKFESTGLTVWEQGGTVNGYGVEITNQIDAGDVFFGNFMDLVIGMWGGLEIMVDPYSGSKKGRLRIVTFQDVDIALRRTQSFALAR